MLEHERYDYAPAISAASDTTLIRKRDCFADEIAEWTFPVARQEMYKVHINVLLFEFKYTTADFEDRISHLDHMLIMLKQERELLFITATEISVL